MVHDGIQVAIIGSPNAGKSSLLNVLAGRDVAIVTDIPGTTRDIVQVPLQLNGVKVREEQWPLFSQLTCSRLSAVIPREFVRTRI